MEYETIKEQLSAENLNRLIGELRDRVEAIDNRMSLNSTLSNTAFVLAAISMGMTFILTLMVFG